MFDLGHKRISTKNAHLQFMNSLKQIFSRFRFALLGVTLGLGAGYLYYLEIGCEEGCTITGSPLNATLYGGLMGGLLLSMIDDYLKKSRK